MKQPRITEIGLPSLDWMDEATFFELGHRLVNAEHGLQWAIGDWYNAIPWGDKEKACNKVGLNFRTARENGLVSGVFKYGARAPELTYSHHRKIIHADINKSQRTELLKLAVAGSKNGACKAWSSERLREERDKILGILPPEPVDGFVEKVDALTEAVIDALPKVAGKKAINTAKRGLKKLADDMQHEFTRAVDKRVDEKLKGRRERLKSIEDEAKATFDNAVRIKAGVKAFMTKAEFALVRSCLHPDKNPHPKANEAFTIFNRLADVKAWDK